MTLVLIGLIVGIIMGLTGAGGALISIPLFLTLSGASLKEATVLSLIAVISGTVLNLFTQKKSSDKNFVLIAVLFGAIANALTLQLKTLTPDWVVGGLLGTVATYSVWSVWSPKRETNGERNDHIGKMIFTGLFLGVLTTLTGLGGGVVLVPILLNVFGKTYEEAMPTSLLSIMLISGISFLMQIYSAESIQLKLSDVMYLFSGSVAAAIGLMLITRKLDQRLVDKTRRIVFTAVTIYSITSIVLKLK